MQPLPGEVLTIHWPLTIPSYATYSLTSPYPLKVTYPHDLSFTLTLSAPTRLSSCAPVHVAPHGVLSPGFARGWSTLPTELKLAILRHNLVYAAAIWPSNANAVLRDTLLPYLRITGEIARLARAVFFEENTFVLLACPDTGNAVGSLLPPLSVRSMVRRVTLMIWLDRREREMIDKLARNDLGYSTLGFVEIRCSVVKFVRETASQLGVDDDGGDGAWDARLNLRIPPEVRLGAQGTISFDRLELGRGGPDSKLLERVERVEKLVKQRFRFGLSSQI